MRESAGTVVHVNLVRIRERAIVAGPGVVAFSILWIATVVPFDYRGSATRDMDFLWQSAGISFLSTDPLNTLLSLHTQPPGLNVLFALDLALSPTSHALLLLVNAFAVIATITMLTVSVLRLTASVPAGVATGLIYALLPGTVLYSLYAYNTTITAFFVMLALWPVTWIGHRPILAVGLSSLGALGLVLTRSSFIWPAMVLWCTALVWQSWRTSKRSWSTVAVTAGPLAVALAVQLHYFVSFGLPFLSSWSGQNLAKALETSRQLTVTAEARNELSRDVCHAAIFLAWQTGQLNVWDPGGTLRQPGCRDLPSVEPRGIPAWDLPLKPGSTEMNFNEGRALLASQQWSGMMSTIVRGDPMQLVRMAITSESGFTESGVGLYLRASDDYPFLDAARKHLPVTTLTQPLSELFAPIMWILVIVGWVTAALIRSSRLRHDIAFWCASGLLVFHAAVSTLLEYSENMRYRAETDPALLFAAAVALMSLLPRRAEQ